VRSGRRDADHGSLEWSRGVESIGDSFASSRSIDVEIFGKTLIAAVKRIYMTEF